MDWLNCLLYKLEYGHAILRNMEAGDILYFLNLVININCLITLHSGLLSSLGFCFLWNQWEIELWKSTPSFEPQELMLG